MTCFDGDELKELLKQKKDIEKRIKTMKCNTKVFGCAKVDTQIYPTNLPDRHYLAIKVNAYNPKGFMGFNNPRYVTIFSNESRGAVIDAIPEIITDLQGLYEKTKGEI